MSIYGAKTPNAPKFDDKAKSYDAILIMSFGGPEGMDDVMPFLENVTKGRNIPRNRLEEVAVHYKHFDGISPINDQNRALIKALKEELAQAEIDLPIYFGNRNWHPLITDTIRQMRDDGVKRAIAFITSAFSSYSGCRQYRENIIEAIETVGDGAPEIDKLRVFYNHPGFINPVVENVKQALEQFPKDQRDSIHIAFTAHSIPMSMAKNSAYEAQLHEACKIVASQLNTDNYSLVYQSRSGSPHIPWLEPDILDHMETLHNQGLNNLVIMPIGFLSDHMEVLFDLDTEAVEKAEELGMTMIRAHSVGTAKPFVRMICDLIKERMIQNPERLALGTYGANHDICPLNCCLPSNRSPISSS